ncbi:MAG TPA: biosynthetic arginine decarboxylase [Rubricoccaceae bacterium]|nr:biosynthetic arginine decarboxylase [Rubricoccaceae bacterium]
MNNTLAPAAPATEAAAWTPEAAAELYHLDTWGESYFTVNEKGHVAARPSLDEPVWIDLYDVVEELIDEGVRFPVLIRLQDLLKTRVVQLNEAFQAAIAEAEYEGAYKGVYPIKVNQLREVVEEILEAGEPYGFGLECGSKTELIATLPLLADDETLLICNGYKDEPMLRLMLTFQGLGKNVIPVVEKYNEFETILRLAQEMDVEPRFGLRVRLASVAAGPWAASSGDHSKFGVSTPELMQIVERLEAEGKTDAFRLVHFHLGSQIGDIQALKHGVKEIARVYAYLFRRGLPIRYLDAGGGLGVNYDATPTGEGRGGVDYSMQEYANAIVYSVREVCDHEDVPHPTLITENGRAITAHHSVLVVEALGVTTKPDVEPDFKPKRRDHEIVRDLYKLWQEVRTDPGRNGKERTLGIGELLEAYHDAIERRQQADALFAFGYLDLEQKALAERLYWAVCHDINERVHREDPDWLPPELYDLDDHLVDQVLLDFSVFQSMMDYWSIGQRFPIVPLHRLDEEPRRRATFVDLTCDSDGKVSRFVSPDEDKRFLEVHPLRAGERYFLGFFLMGAYQDILGDNHNLFGGVTEAHIYADADEEDNYYIENHLPGTTVEQMLARVQYFPHDLQKQMGKLLKRKAREGAIRPKAAQEVLDLYRRSFDDYTYYEATADRLPRKPKR